MNINSGTLNLAGVRQVADVLRPRLDALGFKTTWVDGSAFRRAGHLVAVHPGPGPKILLIGHLDTVFEPTSPFQRFERLDDSTARGPGVIDMKGGDVIALYALRALADAGVLSKMNVTGRVRRGRGGARRAAGCRATRPHRRGEGRERGARLRGRRGGSEDGRGRAPRRGVVDAAHDWPTGAFITDLQPEVGAGAVYEASRILHEFYTQLSSEQYLTFNPGLALGGTSVSVDTTGTTGSAAGKRNVVAEQMTVSGDLRTLSPAQLAAAKRTMTDIASHHLPHTTAAISFDDGYPPLAPSEGNRRLLALYDKASRDLGFGPVTAVDPSRAGAADVSFVAAEVPMILDGIGLSGHDDHSEKETADLRMLAPLTKRAAVLLYRLTQTAAVPKS